MSSLSRSKGRRLSRTLLLCALVAALPACAGDTGSDVDSGIVELTGDGWQWRVGFRPGERATEGWRDIRLPHRFDAQELGADAHEWITLRRSLPAALAGPYRRGEPIAFYSGLISDVARFYLGERRFASLGSVAPYESALYRYVLTGLPHPPAGAGSDPPDFLFILVRSPGDRPLHLEGPTIFAGSPDAVFRRFYLPEFFLLGMAGVLVAIAFYHLQLGLRLPTEIHNLHYALFTLSVAVWMFFRSGIRDEVFGAEVLLRIRVEYTALFLVGPFLLFFLKALFERRLSRFGLAVMAATLPLLVMVWLYSYPTIRLGLKIWQTCAPVVIAYMLYVIGKALWRRNPDALRIAMGLVFLLVLGAYDIVASRLGMTIVTASKFGMPVLIVSTTVLLTNRFVHMYNDARAMNENLESTVAERTRELSAAIERAEAGSRAKSEFLANMSHEIRTPMTAILGMAELLQESQLSPDERRYADTLRRAARNLLELIDGILDVSRIEAGRLELDEIDFELARPIREATEIFEDVAGSKGIALKTEIDPALPARLRGDPGRLRQILVNLIGNAVKFTERGEIALRAYPAATAPSGDATEDDATGGRMRIEFAVRDTGIGIAPEHREAIFEKFSQSDNSITRRFGGTGLGLSICSNLTRLMGGRIRVESVLGRGSTFYFSVLLEPRPDAATPPTADGAPEPPSLAGKRARILLVEDNPDNRFLFQALLKREGLAIETAENGREGLERFRSEGWDIIFMDIQMPVMDGWTATREIRAIEAERRTADPAYRPVPIVALSAGAHEEEIESSLAAGCDAHVVKPFARKDLLATLARFLPGV